LLLFSLLLQVPLIVLRWPLRPAFLPAISGLALLLVGLVLNLWADRLFHRKGVGVCPFSPAPSLVREGPFRPTRNPMYLGMVLASASAPLITGVYLNLWAPAALAAWLHFGFVLPEEAFLRERLGAEYVLYASVHPRWLGLPGRALLEPQTDSTKQR
jgi:protein-S-isoprenylcysteine O-methyltransferase Ste14